MKRMTSVLLLNFGGPTSLDKVRPFLYEIFKDPAIIPAKPGFIRNAVAWFISMMAAKPSRSKYEQIGGASPLLEITARQAAALKDVFEKKGMKIGIYQGMRYGEPSIKNTLADIITNRETEKIIVVPLYPHYSVTTTDSAFRELNRCLKKLSNDIEVSFVSSYEDNPGYINAIEEKLRVQIKAAENNNEVPVILFSAHSLPARIAEKDRSYLDGIHKTAELVARKAGLDKFEFAYQSGRRGWLGPTVEEKLGELAAKGHKSFIVIPLSFTCDNIETLYDIDIKLKKEADRQDVKLLRTESLNDSTLFIEALADIIESRLG